jgi:nitrate/nitrite transporter NarK
MNSGGTIFGEPALMNLICCGLSLVFFLVPKIWAKRAGLFSGAVNMGWACKNFVLLNICRGGECPERLISLYLMLVLSIAIFAMALVPDIKIPAHKD